MDCFKCKQTVTDGVTCSSCKKTLHYECGGTSEITFRKLNMEKRKTWRCVPCKSDSNNTIDSVMAELKKITSELSSFKSISIQVQDQVKELKEEIFHFKKSIDFTNSKLDQFSARFEALESNLHKVDRLESELTSLQSTINILKHKTDRNNRELLETEQRALSNNIEIHGLTETPQENIKKVVLDIGKALGCALNDNDIIESYRTAGSRNTTTRKNNNIIVKFYSRNKKDEILAAVKKKKGIDTNAINVPGEKIRFFINDHLTFKSKQILRAAKEFKKQKNYDFLWTRNSKIMIRKDITSRPIYIYSVDQLEDLEH